MLPGFDQLETDYQLDCLRRLIYVDIQPTGMNMNCVFRIEGDVFVISHINSMEAHKGNFSALIHNLSRYYDIVVESPFFPMKSILEHLGFERHGDDFHLYRDTDGNL